MNPVGRIVMAELGFEAYPGDDVMLAACQAAISHSGMSVVSCTSKRFEPQGLTAIWLLAESHFALHTYPEHGFVSVDCYTCGDEGSPELAVEQLCRLVQPQRVSSRSVVRGVPVDAAE